MRIKQKRRGCVSRLFSGLVWAFVFLIVAIVVSDDQSEQRSASNNSISTARQTETIIVSQTSRSEQVHSASEDPIMDVLRRANNYCFSVVSYEKDSDVLLVELESNADEMSYDLGAAVLYMMKATNSAFETSDASEIFARFFEETEGRRIATITIRVTRETSEKIDYDDFYVRNGHTDKEAIKQFLSMMDGYSLVGEYKALIE